MGWGATERERERERERESQLDRKRETQGGRMQCFMKKKDNSLIDVENLETTYFDNAAFFAALASLLLHFVSSVSVLLLSHSVQLTSISSFNALRCHGDKL